MSYGENRSMRKFFFTSLISLLAFSVFSQNKLVFQKIDSIMSSNYPDDGPGAAVIVYKDNSPFFSGTYGLSNLSDSTKITEATIFRIGSITKQFTSVAVLQLIEQEQLALTDVVSDFYVEWFSDKPSITIEQLLTHTSGVVDLSQVKGVRDLIFKDSEPDSLVKLISYSDLLSRPGSTYSYSNAGYVIIGGIIEKITGLSYDAYLKKYIFDPLKMYDTHYLHDSRGQKNIAQGYFKRSGKHVEAPKVNPSLLFSAGGIRSTVGDMAKFNLALNSNKLVTKKLLDLAFTPAQLTDETYTDYGFAFRQCEINSVPSIEHGGGVFGFSSYGVRIEEEGVYVLVLTNFERDNDYDIIAPLITAEVIGLPYHDSKQGLSIDKSVAIKLTGEYKVDTGDTLNISFKDNFMYMERFGTKRKLMRTGLETFYSLEYSVIFDSLAPNKVTLKHRRSMPEKAKKLLIGQ